MKSSVRMRDQLRRPPHASSETRLFGEKRRCMPPIRWGRLGLNSLFLALVRPSAHWVHTTWIDKVSPSPLPHVIRLSRIGVSMLPRTLSRCVSCDILVDSCRVDSVCARPKGKFLIQCQYHGYSTHSKISLYSR